MNRALSGAIKEKIVIGSDLKEYTRNEYEYDLHEITQNSGQNRTSFLIDPKAVKTYARNSAENRLILAKTVVVQTELAPGQYVMKSRTNNEIDHYSDNAHSQAQAENYSEYEYDEATNELRVSFKRSFVNTKYEITESYEYDDNGNLTQKKTEYTGSGLEQPADKIVAFEYDGYGNQTKQSDISGNPSRVSEVVYDLRLHQFATEKRSVGDSITLTEGFTINYEKAFGGIDTKTDANGNKNYYSYDDYGRLIEARADTDEGVRTTATYHYNSDRPLSVKVEQPTGTSDVDFAMRVYYDGLGRTIHTVRRAGTASGQRYTRTGRVVYDAMGKSDQTEPG